jgi:hypothetical protein
MEAVVSSDPANELQALARQKGYRLMNTEKAGHYWLVDGENGLPAVNPVNDTMFFDRASALQFLLEAHDISHGSAEPRAA